MKLIGCVARSAAVRFATSCAFHHIRPASGIRASASSTALISFSTLAASAASEHESQWAACSRKSASHEPDRTASMTNDSFSHSNGFMDSISRPACAQAATPHQSRKSMTRSKQQRPNALLLESNRFGNLPVAGAFHIREPQQFSFARLQTLHHVHHVRAQLKCLLTVLVGCGSWLLNLIRRRQRAWLNLAVAPVIAHEVRRDPKQIVLHVVLIHFRKAHSEKAEVTLLHQVIGQRRVARGAVEIRPERARGAVVEGSEALLIHLEGRIDRADSAPELLCFRQCEFFQHELCSAGSLAAQSRLRASRIVPRPCECALRTLEQTEVFCQDIRYSARHEEANAQGEDERAEYREAHVCVRDNFSTQEQHPGAQERRHNSNLNGPENPSEGQRGHLLALPLEDRRLQEFLACVRFHVREHLLARAEAIQQLRVRLGLHLHHFVPAAIIENHPQYPQQRAGDHNKYKERTYLIHHTVEVAGSAVAHAIERLVLELAANVVHLPSQFRIGKALVIVPGFGRRGLNLRLHRRGLLLWLLRNFGCLGEFGAIIL